MPIAFNDLARKVLSPEQQSLKPLLEEFSKTHMLVGGTAIALMLGHRKSIDFDFFRFGKQGTGKELAARIEKTGLPLESGSDFFYLSEKEEPEANLIIKGVKVQLMDFSRNPFGIPLSIPAEQTLCDGIPAPSLLDLAAMKFYALMYRRKWKDAVDLYWILKKTEYDFESVMKRSEAIFTQLLQVEASLETLLENQWDTSEAVEYVDKALASDEEMGEDLKKRAEDYLAEKR